MGVLYKAATAEKNLKHNFVLKKLRKLGVTASQDGVPIEQLDYDSLKYEYVMATFRQADVESDENKWF